MATLEENVDLSFAMRPLRNIRLGIRILGSCLLTCPASDDPAILASSCDGAASERSSRERQLVLYLRDGSERIRIQAVQGDQGYPACSSCWCTSSFIRKLHPVKVLMAFATEEGP